jgi:hypothetical protein
MCQMLGAFRETEGAVIEGTGEPLLLGKGHGTIYSTPAQTSITGVLSG